MLPAQYRLRRSFDFGATVRQGRRAAECDIVIYLRGVRPADDAGDSKTAMSGPKVGLIVARSVGTAVQRHAVSRRLRHVAREMLTKLQPREQIVVRALPGSVAASSAELSEQLHAGLHKLRSTGGTR